MGEAAVKRQASVLITDLDNTLFDWVAMWGAAFRGLVDETVRISGIAEAELLPAMRKLHQKHGTTEYTFLLEDLSLLQDKYKDKGQDLSELFAPAYEKYNLERDAVLRLYPGVAETLLTVKGCGSAIIAYTESLHFVTMWRIQKLGLDGVLDVVYSPHDHEISPNVSLSKKRSRPDEAYSLKATKHRHTPEGEKKPNRQVLLDIVAELGAPISDVVYVGDSLMKDIAMAKDAGVLDVHAKYGESHNTSAYELLRKVSHWKDEDVERERKIQADRATVVPTLVLDKGFGDLLSHVQFMPFRGKLRDDGLTEKDKIGWSIDAWKKTIDVQQHFNDLQLRIRTFSITFVAALLSVAGLIFKEDKTSLLPGVLVAAVSALALLAFWFMDKKMYHSLLKGANEHAGSVEQQLANATGRGTFGLATRISQASGVKLLGVEVRSSRRLDLFYIVLCLVMVLLGLGLGAMAHFNAKAESESHRVVADSLARASAHADSVRLSDSLSRRRDLVAPALPTSQVKADSIPALPKSRTAHADSTRSKPAGRVADTVSRPKSRN